MLRHLIAFCLSRRPLALVGFAAFLGIGYAAFTTLNVEAYPDPSPPIIEIIAQYPGQSPEEVERYVTVPLEIAVASTPGLTYIRSNTVFALGFIRLQFEYGRDYNFVRQQVTNRLKDATLPATVTPVISPAGGISEIIRYQLKGPPGMDLIELKTLQDWVVERKLRIVPGISDISPLGGKTKEYQAEIDLDRMRAYGLTLPQIISAISTSNANVGGRNIAVGEQAVNVRGIGALSSLTDIDSIVLSQQGGLPVLLRDIARDQVGFTPRMGIAGRDSQDDVLFGIVLMQKNERTMDVVTRVRAAIERINTDGSLPQGVRIDTFYDRGDLVGITVRTVMHNMLFGIVLIFLIQWIFLGNLRCALIVAATIPVALFLAVIITVLRGDSANLLSVGAIDLGIIVDGTVIMVENVFRHLAHQVGREISDRDSKLTDKLRRILNAAVEVDKAILFSVIITIAAFLPLFTMQGVEGQIFGPMSRTYAYALLGAVIATFTVTPVMSSLLLPDKVSEVETFLVRQLRAVYQRVLSAAVGNARLAAVVAVAFLVVCGGLGMRLGTEFLPKLEEGNLWIRALLPPTITLEAGRETTNKIRNIIASYAPVRTVVSEQGRGEDGTDPDGSFIAEFFVPLKPFEEWPDGLTKPKLVKEMAARLESEFIGIDFNFSQYIQDNIEEAVSGVKGENSVKIFGRSLDELERLSRAVKDELAKVPGITDPAAFNLLGQPNLLIQVDRAKAARYGITVTDINTVVQAAIGGQEITRVYEGEMNFPPHHSPRLAIPGQYRHHPFNTGRSAESRSEVADQLYRAGRRRHRAARNGRRLYLPGKHRTFRSDQIQRARPRPGLDRCRSAGAYRQERGAQGRLSPGVVGRVRRAGRSQEAARRHHPAQPDPDHDAALQPVQFRARQSAGAVRHSVRGLRRHSRALCFRFERQRVGRRRIHLAVRRVGDGWHPAGLLHSPRHGPGPRQRRGHHPGGANPHAADFHDRFLGLHRPGAGGAIHRHRFAGSTAAGLRDRRRHVAVADLQLAGDSDLCPADDAGGPQDSDRRAKSLRLTRAPARSQLRH